ncbi:phosphotransferase [Okibacterium endophyticum]
MARSHLTLAALATSAAPGLVVTGSGVLGSPNGGDFDSALLRTAAGADVVVRVPAHERAASEQSIEIIALQAMTQGIRSRLPFDVPAIMGQAPLETGRAVVYDYLPGYSVEAENIPAGDGAATSIGAAIAAVHSLPGSFVSDVGLPHLSAAQSREEARNVIDRASAARRLPAAVKKRWLDAVDDDTVWQFQPTVINGAVRSDSFLITDHEAGPVVSGMLGWGSLQVGDPARDLHWLSGAEDAAQSVIDGYRSACTRHPDSHIVQRSLLHAELELARWLLHGIDTRDESVVEDAVVMLDGLVDSVLGEMMYPLTPQTGPIMAVSDVEAMLERTPQARPAAAAQGSEARHAAYAMETDSYDREELAREFGTSEFDIVDGQDSAEGDRPEDDLAANEPVPDAPGADELATGPISTTKPDHGDPIAAVHRRTSSSSE